MAVAGEQSHFGVRQLKLQGDSTPSASQPTNFEQAYDSITNPRLAEAQNVAFAGSNSRRWLLDDKEVRGRNQQQSSLTGLRGIRSSLTRVQPSRHDAP